jgi:hypothetical protein
MWSTRALCCVMLLLLLLPAGATRAGDVAFSSVLPNGAVFTQKVESMQERRFRNMVRQHTDYS